MIRVVIADDQELVRAGLSMILDAQPDIEIVGQAADGVEAISLTRELKPDLVLMDIRMPKLDGLDAMSRLLAADPALPVIVLTTFDTDEYVYRALAAGASGFLLKTSPPARLIDCVRLANSGDALLAPAITRRMVEDWMRRTARAAVASPLLGRLTEREREVLVHLGRGRSNGEIAATLTLTEATVKTHVNRILGKLELRSRVQAVVFAYENGLVQPGSP